MPASGVSEAVALWLGPDRVRKRERLHALQQELSVHLLDWHSVQAAELSAGSLAMWLREVPAASARKVLIVDDALRLDRACVECIRDYAGRGSPPTRLIVLIEGSLPAAHPLHELMRQVVVERFETASGESRQPFALVHAIANRQMAEALRVVHDELENGKDALELISLVAWQVQRWLTVKRLRESGASTQEIVTAVGCQPWQADRLLAEVADCSAAWLRESLEACWEVETRAKSGRLPILRLALEELVIRVCRPARGRDRVTCARSSSPAYAQPRVPAGG